MTDDTDLYRALGRMESKMDQIMMAHHNHGTRIDVLERAKTWVIGTASAFAFMISIAYEYIKSSFNHN